MAATSSLSLVLSGDGRGATRAVALVARSVDRAGAGVQAFGRQAGRATTAVSQGFRTMASGAGKATKAIGAQFDALNKKIASTAKERGPEAMAAAGTAAGAAFTAGLVSAIQADAGNAKLQAQLGLTEGESKRIGGVAGKLYAQAYGESMDEVRTSITSVIQNMDGLRTASSSALQETTGRAMTLATVMDEEVGGVTRAVSQMLRTGLASSATEAFDVLTAAQQRGLNSSGDLLDTFTEYSTKFRDIGVSAQSALGLVQQMLKGGARDADTAADALKEFSIIATSGADSAADAFKALGLEPKKMFAVFSKGGPEATKAFDTVVERMQKFKGTAKETSVTTALFGTKAEDLGDALFAMDPSSATQAFKDFNGATDKAGKALSGTTAAAFERFKREGMLGLQTAAVGTVEWMQRNQTTTKVLAGAVGVLATAYIATTIALQATTAGTVLNTIVTKTASAATKAWSAAQWLLNAAMSANPIGLIIVGIVALVAALVLAYKNSATFRRIVDAAWAGIKDAAVKAWAVLQPILNMIWTVIKTYVITYFTILSTIVKAAWSAISWAISAAWALIQPVFNAIVGFVKGTLSVVWTVLLNVFKAAWIGIQIYIKVVWAIMKGIFYAIKLVVTEILAPVFMWLYNNVIKPVWSGMSKFIRGTWTVIKVIFGAIKSYISTVLAPVFRWLWGIVKTVWGGIKTAISVVWNSGIKPVFNALKSALGYVKDAFTAAVNGIKSIWGKLADIAKKPINFVIGMYNTGIVGLVNKIADFAGIDTRLGKIPLLARGGTLADPAQMGPMKTNGPLAIVGEGRKAHPEYVIPTDPRFRSRAMGLWMAAGKDLAGWVGGPSGMAGEGLAYERGGRLPFQALAGGGVIGSFIGGLKNWTLGNVSSAAGKVLDKLIGSIPGSGVMHDTIAAIPKWLKKTIVGWIKGKVSSGGAGMERALGWARSQAAGLPYLWGGVGPNGYDCSGFMSALLNVIQGKSPYSRRFTTHSFGASSGPGGFVRDALSGFRVGVTDSGVGHMAGTLLGVPVESSGSAGVRVGGGARGADNGLFSRRYGLKADTGALTLGRGWNPPVLNQTGATELLMTKPNWEQMAAAGAGSGATFGDININHVPGFSTVQDVERALRRAELERRHHRRK